MRGIMVHYKRLCHLSLQGFIISVSGYQHCRLINITMHKSICVIIQQKMALWHFFCSPIVALLRDTEDCETSWKCLVFTHWRICSYMALFSIQTQSYIRIICKNKYFTRWLHGVQTIGNGIGFISWLSVCVGSLISISFVQLHIQFAHIIHIILWLLLGRSDFCTRSETPYTPRTLQQDRFLQQNALAHIICEVLMKFKQNMQRTLYIPCPQGISFSGQMPWLWRR